VGRHLAVIGDEVDQQYSAVFNKMIDNYLPLSPAPARLNINTPTTVSYSILAAIARQSVYNFV